MTNIYKLQTDFTFYILFSTFIDEGVENHKKPIWDINNQSETVAYYESLEAYSTAYHAAFPENETKTKAKTFWNAWLTKGIIKL